MGTPFRLQPKPYIVPPCTAELEVMATDEHFVVVKKPPGLLSVPGRDPRNRDSVYTRLLEQSLNPVIVHRLDLETSGLMVVGRTPLAASRLGWQFQHRKVDKRYVAVVDGLMETDSGDIDLPLIVDWENRPLQKICHATGKPALTRWRVLARDPDLQRTRVQLEPVTGRSHQLRVHMMAIGHPIVGCQFYAPDAVCMASDRLLLHAAGLQFMHPASESALEFSADPAF